MIFFENFDLSIGESKETYIEKMKLIEMMQKFQTYSVKVEIDEEWTRIWISGTLVNFKQKSNI